MWTGGRQYKRITRGKRETWLVLKRVHDAMGDATAYTAEECKGLHVLWTLLASIMARRSRERVIRMVHVIDAQVRPAVEEEWGRHSGRFPSLSLKFAKHLTTGRLEVICVRRSDG